MTTLNSETVLAALRNVQDPDLRKDLVTLGMIRDLEVDPGSGSVSLRVVLTTPSCPLRGQIEADVRAALTGIAGVRTVSVKMDAEVRKGAAAAGTAPIEGVRNIIAVSSGKGGVGKSTVAVNLAVALAMDGARVGLMDADVYGPNVPTMMGVTEQPKIEETGEVFIPPSAHGVRVMSMGFLIPGDQPLVWRGPMLHSVISQFCHKVRWGELDYLVVDMPPGTGDVQLSLAQLVPVTCALLVSTPQEVSMQNVRKAFYMFEKVRVPVVGIVENMSSFRCDGCGKQHFPFGSQGGEALSKKFGVPLLAQIPIIPSVREGGDEGRPAVVRDPESEVARAFREMARRLAREVSILANRGPDPSEIVQIGRFD
jgi:ATP-binding protein involved in chromosome partitioning